MGEKSFLPGGAGIFGQKIDSGEPGANVVFFDQRTVASDEAVRGASKRWLWARHTDFDELDGLFVDRSTKTVYQRVNGQPLLADGPGDVDVFFVQPDDGDGPKLVFLSKTGTALHELQRETAQAAAERSRDEAALAEVRAKQLDRQPRRVVTLADLEGRPLPTPRQAAQLLEGYRGRIEARDSRLRVELPELLTEPGSWDAPTAEAEARARVADAVRVLLACKETVLAELAVKAKTPLASRLPGTPLGCDGTVA